MARSFLDTSALVKRYHFEEGSDFVDTLFGSDSAILISRLSVIETVSALALKVRSGILPLSAYESARKKFLGDVAQKQVGVVRLLASHYHHAGRLIHQFATQHRLRTLDALQLSVAFELHQTDGIDFVCADVTLCEIAVLLGLTVTNPVQPPSS